MHWGIIGEDDRVLLQQQGPPWDAIGQVNVATMHCTGTLVSPTVVITAAHCVVDVETQVPFPMTQIHFVAGVRGSDKGHATARCLHFLPGYTYTPPVKITARGREYDLTAFENDVVAVVLQAPLAIDPFPTTEIADPQPGLALSHVAYPADPIRALGAVRLRSAALRPAGRAGVQRLRHGPWKLGQTGAGRNRRQLQGRGNHAGRERRTLQHRTSCVDVGWAGRQ